MSAIHVVGRQVSCAGFALAGVPTHEVRGAEAKEVLAALVDQDDLGVLFVEQSLLDAMEPATQRALMQRPSPIIVPFPGPAWRTREEASDALVLDLLQRAIGYRVRLR